METTSSITRPGLEPGTVCLVGRVRISSSPLKKGTGTIVPAEKRRTKVPVPFSRALRPDELRRLLGRRDSHLLRRRHCLLRRCLLLRSAVGILFQPDPAHLDLLPGLLEDDGAAFHHFLRRAGVEG